ncbi:MAG: hypothetical protein ACLQNE_23400 [Thermoguttaceae bacterium]
MSAQEPDEQGEEYRVCKEVVVRVFPVVLEAFEELKKARFPNAQISLFLPLTAELDVPSDDREKFPLRVEVYVRQAQIVVECQVDGQPHPPLIYRFGPDEGMASFAKDIKQRVEDVARERWPPKK